MLANCAGEGKGREVNKSYPTATQHSYIDSQTKILQSSVLELFICARVSTEPNQQEAHCHLQTQYRHKTAAATTTRLLQTAFSSESISHMELSDLVTYSRFYVTIKQTNDPKCERCDQGSTKAWVSNTRSAGRMQRTWL